MQEELLDGSHKEGEIASSTEIAQQMIRQLEAQEAVYSYKSGKLEAKKVEIGSHLAMICGRVYLEHKWVLGIGTRDAGHSTRACFAVAKLPLEGETGQGEAL